MKSQMTSNLNILNQLQDSFSTNWRSLTTPISKLEILLEEVNKGRFVQRYYVDDQLNKLQESIVKRVNDINPNPVVSNTLISIIPSTAISPYKTQRTVLTDIANKLIQSCGYASDSDQQSTKSNIIRASTDPFKARILNAITLNSGKIKEEWKRTLSKNNQLAREKD